MIKMFFSIIVGISTFYLVYFVFSNKDAWGIFGSVLAGIFAMLEIFILTEKEGE